MRDQRPRDTADRRGLVVAAIVYVLTALQLAIATFVPGLPQFEGKAFGSRLVAYPLMMAALPVVWWLVARRPPIERLPWTAFALVMSPFLIDVTGNSADLYDTLTWWDDANHFGNWLLLCWGCGLLLARGGLAPRGRSPSPPLGWARCSPSAGRSASGTRSSDTAPSWTRPTRTRSATRRSAHWEESWRR